MPAASSLAKPAIDNAEIRGRILRQARTDFFSHGYSSLTMEGLATELGNEGDPFDLVRHSSSLSHSRLLEAALLIF